VVAPTAKRSPLKLGVVIALLIAGCGGAVAWFGAGPAVIDPVAWDCPAHDGARWASPAAVEGLVRTTLSSGHGPEDVEMDADGRVYGGTADGSLLRWSGPGAKADKIAETGGRPLGLHWDAAGRLLVADAFAGLLRVDVDSGAVEVLATTCGGTPMRFTDDLDVAADGAIWFSDASARFDQTSWKADILENRPSGRLCRWDPVTGVAEEKLTGLAFANGVALDPEGRFALVNETARYRVRRLWLDGPAAGSDDVLIDDLPGFPDGISAGRGRFWVAIASPRNPIVDATAGWPRLRAWMARLPPALQPKPERSVRMVGVDAQGRVVHDLADLTGRDFAVVTSVQERDGWLLLGSLTEPAWARLPAPAPPGGR
jgi:hypothetical protein